MLKVVWKPEYLNYDFGPGHPFWAGRGTEFLKLLEESSISYEVAEPIKASDKDLLLVHTPGYLEGVKRLYCAGRNLSPDTPLRPGVLEAAYYSVGGSVLASRLALSGQRVINLLGGLHHAETAHGGGFCIFSDHAVAIRRLQKEGQIKKAMIYDLDVHAGNGTQEIFYFDPTVFNISLHQDPRTLYPGTGLADQIGKGEGEGYNLNIPLPPGTGGREYLKALDRVLPLYDEFAPDLLLLILGVDTYRGDPLASFELEVDDYFKIGQRFSKFKKLTILCAGGYSKETPNLWLRFLEGLL